jgi:hypothetical protein
MIDDANSPEAEVNDLFVRAAFTTIGRLAGQVDAAYWSFFDVRES